MIDEPGRSGGGVVIATCYYRVQLTVDSRTVIVLVAAAVLFAVGLFGGAPKMELKKSWIREVLTTRILFVSID